MLAEEQIQVVWERRLGAEARALYFADLANRRTALKQRITFFTFFLSSGAAATLIAKAPTWVPMVLSLIAAGMTAYSVAKGLDRLIPTLAKLHHGWSELADGYERLWNHFYDEDAPGQLDELLRRERELSLLATTEAPYQPDLVAKWQDHVLAQHGVAEA